MGHSIKASDVGISNKHSNLPLSAAVAKPIKSIHEMGIPFRVLGKEDIKNELSKTKEIFNMTPDEFYKAWKEDKVHGFHALKFGCLYEFYRNEYE